MLSGSEYPYDGAPEGRELMNERGRSRLRFAAEFEVLHLMEQIMSHRFLAPVLASVLFFAAGTAKAETPATGFRVGGGLASGNMLNEWENGVDRIRGLVNPQGLGFLGRVGYSFSGGFYVGGSMKIFLGQKVDEPPFKATFMAQQFAVDLGYAFGINEQLSIRPIIELGLNRYGMDEQDPPDFDWHENDVGFWFAPGIDLVADITEHIFLGGGLRFGFAFMGDSPISPITDEPWVSENGNDVSIQLLVEGGFRF